MHVSRTVGPSRFLALASAAIADHADVRLAAGFAVATRGLGLFS